MKKLKKLLVLTLLLILGFSRIEAQKSGEKHSAATQKMIDALSPNPVTDWLAVRQSILDGADVNVVFKGGYATPLTVVCQYDQSEIEKMLINKGANVNIAGPDGQTPLHYAVESNYYEIVVLLIAKGAEIDAPGYKNATPLYYAAEAGNLKAVKLLIAKGANVNAQDDDGQRPLHKAASWHSVSKNPFAEVVRVLIENGAEVNAKDHELTTPLHIAAKEGYTDIAMLLIEKGADVNAVSKDDETPLDLAKTDKIKNLLSSHGARNGNHDDY
jgi:ankyrin repeat protein